MDVLMGILAGQLSYPRRRTRTVVPAARRVATMVATAAAVCLAVTAHRQTPIKGFAETPHPKGMPQ